MSRAPAPLGGAAGEIVDRDRYFHEHMLLPFRTGRAFTLEAVDVHVFATLEGGQGLVLAAYPTAQREETQIDPSNCSLMLVFAQR